MNIELKGVSKTYRPSRDAAVRAVREIDMIIRQGERVALMGPSGCGKTTLLSILGLLSRPTAGRYFLDGRDVCQLSRAEQARFRGERIGFIFQSYNLLPREQAWRNVIMPLSFQTKHRGMRRQRAMEAMAAVNLLPRARHYPAQMSGGEQQRVAIARALVNRPRLLIADEPTGNLDSSTGKEIMDLISNVAKQCEASVIMATHDRSVADCAERIIEMRDGRIRE